MSSKRRSQVFRHFDVPESCDESGNFKAKCKHCLQHIGASNRASSNLLRHLQRKHAAAIYSTNMEVAVVPMNTSEHVENAGHVEYAQLTQHTQHAQNAQHASHAPHPIKLEQPPIINFMQYPNNYSPADARQMEITDALLTFIVSDSIPLSTVDSPHFHALLNALDPHYPIPSRNDLMYLCIEKSDELRFDIGRRLQGAHSVCITVNLWTNRSKMKTVIGLTGHYIVGWTLQSVVLACEQVQGRPTSDNILQHYEKILPGFDDLSAKISNIVTDNDKNMRTLFNLPWLDNIDGRTTDDDYENSHEVVHDFDEGLVEIDYDSAYDFLPAHQECFAHNLQLVLKDAFKETTLIHKVLSKAATIVKSARGSPIAAAEILETGNQFQVFSATKWKSQLAMIRSILNLKPEDINQLNTVPLAIYERNLLEHLVEILTLFEQATEFVNADNCVTASYILPCVRGIRIGLQKLSSGYNSKLVAILQAAVQERMSSYERVMIYKLAAALDPRFKLDWCSADEYTDMRRDLLVKTSSLATQISPNGGDVNVVDSPPRKKIRLLSFLYNEPALIAESVDKEVQGYLIEPCIDENADPLAYWKVNERNYPNLAKLALQYLCLPASSVERLFSTNGKPFCPDSSQLNQKTFDNLMFLRCNGLYPK